MSNAINTTFEVRRETLDQTPERALSRDRVERREMAQLVAQALIRFCDRCHENLELP